MRPGMMLKVGIGIPDALFGTYPLMAIDADGIMGCDVNTSCLLALYPLTRLLGRNILFDRNRTPCNKKGSSKS
jgi:hypothetical protein